jgi:O-antigen/teichoic acid export membrane protein
MISAGILSASGLIFGFGNSVFIARLSSPEVLGVQALWIAMAGWAVSIGQFGFRSWIVRQVSNTQISLQGLTKIAAITALAALAVSPLFFIILQRGLNTLGADSTFSTFLLFGLYAVLKVTTANFSSANKGLGRITFATFIEKLLERLIVFTYLISLVLSSEQLKVETLLIVMTGACFASASTNAISIAFSKSSLASARGNQLPTFLEVLPFWSVSISNLFAQRIDMLILGIVAPTETIGFYRIATSLVAILGIAPESAKAAVLNLLPQWTNKAQKRKRIRREVKNVVRLSTAAVGFGTLILFFSGKDFLSAIWGLPYEAAYPIMMILCLSKLVNTSVGPAGMTAVLNGLEEIANLGFWTAATVNLILSLILVQLIDAAGVAVASGTLISNVIFNSILLYYVVKKIRFNTSAF